jgi:hypothetical protein
LREESAALAESVHLFAPAPAYRVQRDTNTDTPLPPDEPAAANPPDGAIIDYYLPAAANAVRLEILDAQGHLVRSYTSDDKPEMSEEELQKQLIPLYWVRPFQALSTGGGMHRWIWDLHYPAPTATRHEYPIAAIPHDTPRYPVGPTALPASYTVRLTVDGKTSTATLTVKMDPRVKTSTLGLQKKFKAETRLASIFSETSQAFLQGSSIREQLEKLDGQGGGSTKDALQALDKKLSILLGATGGFFAPPTQEVTLARVNGNAGTLYQQVWQPDAEPTSSQMQALAEMEVESVDVLKRWNEFKSADLLKINRQLREAKVPEIQLESNPQHEESQVDEE